MRKLWLLLVLVSGFYASAQPNEVMYHVFQRSFFDGDGDGDGDLKGMTQKLDYLKELGVTTILLTPLYQSDFYHNYFATDFEKIDPKYGTMKEYAELIKQIHIRKMKVYQDVEMQYVTGKHPWFADSFKIPKSQYSNYLFYIDKQNQKPYYFLGVPEFTTYNNSKEQIIVVNMKDAKVKEYTYKVLKYWMDPNNDGRFEDGVDGYRLDHMMDNLDNSGKLTNLFKDFWTPLLNDLRKINPDLQIVAEQANWNSYGYDYFTKGNVDRVFAFRLKQTIGTFDKKEISAAADSTFRFLPKGKQQVIFIENHDTNRFASEPGMNPGKLRVAAALNVLIGGVPSIYYGQELGMKGVQLKGSTDGNDIPMREAFEWYAAEEGAGMAAWYKGTGPWWDSRNMKPNDGISLEEQRKDPNSLWNFYKAVIRIKKTQPAVGYGDYREVTNTNDNVFSFLRDTGREKVLVMINLSGNTEDAIIDQSNKLKLTGLQQLMGTKNESFKKGSRAAKLLPYEVLVWRFISGQ